jgi:hypothetical protein
MSYKKEFPAYHSHGYSDPHEAEGEEDDDVPVLAVLNQGEGQLLHRLWQRAAANVVKLFTAVSYKFWYFF